MRRGIPTGILDAACGTADALHAVSPNLPPLFTLKHLAVESQVPYEFLRDVVMRSVYIESYRVFKLRKSAVGHAPTRFRYICVPQPYLLQTQRWIHTNILTQVKCHEASSAYHRDSKIIETARLHCGCRWMIKLDVTNFFESILEPSVYKAFLGMGYQPLRLRLCSRAADSLVHLEANARDSDIYS
jgi:RNA-directed DNA polymerase